MTLKKLCYLLKYQGNIDHWIKIKTKIKIYFQLKGISWLAEHKIFD